MRGWRRWRTGVLLGMAVLAGAAAAEGVRALGPAPAGAAVSAPGSGDTDREIAAALITHYRGTIDAAAPLVEHGRDPELRELAGDLVELQRRQIEFLREWLAAHPG